VFAAVAAPAPSADARHGAAVLALASITIENSFRADMPGPPRLPIGQPATGLA
jgi:hypothetical protein